MNEVIKRAWAIKATNTDIDGTVKSGLLGVYYFGFPQPASPITVQLFRTRAEARAALRHQKTDPTHAWSWDKSHRGCVVKVLARISEV